MTTFDLYARYYDLLYSDKDYSAEAQYVAKHLQKHSDGIGRILELGCGTGAHAVALATAGFNVVGVDVSGSMLSSALRRLSERPELRDRVHFTHADVREYRTGEQFDAVISLFHVLSYQTSNADVLNVLSTASVHLPLGGLFLFDFWYGPAVLSQRPDTRLKEFEDERVRVTRVAQPKLRENDNLVEVDYTIIVMEKDGGRSERIRETHVMRYLFLPEIDFMLETMGMQRLYAKEWLTDDEPGVNSWSGFVVARKVEG